MEAIRKLGTHSTYEEGVKLGEEITVFERRFLEMQQEQVAMEDKWPNRLDKFVR